VEETDELLVAIDDGTLSAETERTFSLEEVRAEIKEFWYSCILAFLMVVLG
jgi:hypothetical protein